MEFNQVEIFGLIAAFLTTSSFLPQAIKTIKDDNTKEISLLMYSSFSTGVLFWLIYGTLIGSVAMMLANSITLFFSLTILIIKIKNVRNGTDK